MRRIWRDNGLSIVLGLLFVVFLAGQAWTGLQEYNSDQAEHGDAPVTLGAYLRTGHFWEVTAENW
jgi:hypothetical protein